MGVCMGRFSTSCILVARFGASADVVYVSSVRVVCALQ